MSRSIKLSEKGQGAIPENAIASAVENDFLTLDQFVLGAEKVMLLGGEACSFAD